MFARRQRLLRVCSIVVWLLVAVPASLADESNSSSERELLDLLRSAAPSAEKAIACKKLAIQGSSESVPELAKLLPDAQLSSWARIALEVIPGEEADLVLREAVGLLTGELLVGTINSIGVRRDHNAVDVLSLQLQHADPEVTAAAAVALGKIGDQAAGQVLLTEHRRRQQQLSGASPSTKTRSAIAEGLILRAEQLLAAGEPAAAATIYDELRASELPSQRILEATRGAILARKEAGLALLMDQFRSPEPERFLLALTVVREFPKGEIDRLLADELPQTTAERAALLVQAMADRETTVVLAAILKAAESGPRETRISAINALQRVGDASCLSALLAMALESDTDVAEVAKDALCQMADENVDAEITRRLSDDQGELYPLLIELVGARRIDAVPSLVSALDHADARVRSAAFLALGETVGPEQLSQLVSHVVHPKHREDLPIALQSLQSASVRMPDREACAAELNEAFAGATTVSTKIELLEILAQVGGTRALATVRAGAQMSDPQLVDVSSRLLGGWMTEDAAPVLLELVQTAPEEKYQVRALRGYIRIARQFVLSEEQRAEMCRQAWLASRRTAEKKLVLEVLERYPSLKSLALAIEFQQASDLRDDAIHTTFSIVQNLGPNRPGVAERLAETGMERVDLEILKAEYGADSRQQDVTLLLREQSGDWPVITLAAAGYNASLGGDPLPGVSKQLRIQYRINGKAGEATFAENELIVLPMPN